MVIESVSLKHVLTDFEMAALARSQAQAFDKMKVTENDLAAIKKDYGGRLALANAEIGSISARINTGFEHRNVPCLLLDERPEGYRLVVRSDNGHIAIRRKLEPHERQLKITTDEPREFEVIATMAVDDATWEVDIFEVGLFADEADALKNCPDVQTRPFIRHRAIEAGAPQEDGKKRASKKK